MHPSKWKNHYFRGKQLFKYKTFPSNKEIAGWRVAREPFKLSFLLGNFPRMIQPSFLTNILLDLREDLDEIAICVEQKSNSPSKHWPSALASLVFSWPLRTEEEAETSQRKQASFHPSPTTLLLHKSRWWNASHEQPHLPEGQHFPISPEVHQF